MSTGFIRCKSCRFWNGADNVAGLCRRHAPPAGERPYEVARWPETRDVDGCGEGELNAGKDDHGVDKGKSKTCGHCQFWHRPGIGIDPAQRGDRHSSWWQQAGWCRRFAPKPGIDIGEHGYWRATHATDFCHDGRWQ